MNVIYLFIVGILYGNFHPSEPETVDLQIVITNIDIIKGTIEMGVFKNPKTFLKKGQEYKIYSKKVTDNTILFNIKGIEKGSYAIAVYHDKNSDKECNKNFIGIPIEPYGFSKNFKPTMSKPKFEDCKITATENTSIEIKLLD